MAVGLATSDGDDLRPISDARPAECLDVSLERGNQVGGYTRRPCKSGHGFEVVGVVTSTAAKGDAYPGSDALDSLGQKQCLPLFAGYVGIGFGDSQLLIRLLTPNPDSWASGDRETICLVQSGDGHQLVGSVRNSRR